LRLGDQASKTVRYGRSQQPPKGARRPARRRTLSFEGYDVPDHDYIRAFNAFEKLPLIWLLHSKALHKGKRSVGGAGPRGLSGIRPVFDLILVLADGPAAKRRAFLDAQALPQRARPSRTSRHRTHAQGRGSPIAWAGLAKLTEAILTGYPVQRRTGFPAMSRWP
jgi:hypothetical protein